uniref:Peptidase M13 C-terminal domain-containing protein n=1 Tax=Plectus sambesii TaxID=2011161 RepID=A0A914WXG5_9BILA
MNPLKFSPIFNIYAADLAIRNEAQMTTVEDQLMIRDMIELIRQGIRQKLMDTYWMKNSRDLLKNLDQLLMLFKIVGFSEHLFNTDNLTQSELNHFSSFDEDYFSIVERMIMSNLRLIFKLPRDAYLDSFMINAFNANTHIILFFLPLQNPYFNRHFPDSYNIGFTGSIIAHEFFHSFAPNMAHDRFYQYAQYNKSLSCYDSFYSENMCFNLTLGGNKTRMCVDGKNDMIDNIPDVEGTRVAFEILKQKLGDDAKLKLLPLPDHLPFTNEQLFFIARSQFWCDNDFFQDETMAQSLRNPGPHSPHIVRVNAVAMQMSEFGEAFSCSPTDPMVTTEEEKCYLLPSDE